MDNVLLLTPNRLADEAFEALIPQIVDAAAAAVGPAGVQAFFAGYIPNVEERKLAA